MEYLNDDEYNLLKKTFNDRFLTIDHKTSKQEKRIIAYLTSLDLLIKESFYYRASDKGVLFLAERGIGERVIKILESFLQDSKGHLEWNLEEILEYFKKSQVDRTDLIKALKFGDDLEFLECSWSRCFWCEPTSIKITLKGEKFARNPYTMFSYITIDERDLKTNYDDQTLLNWVKNSANGSEDFELEYKATCPSTTMLREIISGFGNYLSGVLCIGFRDNGELIGIEYPDRIRNRVYSAVQNMKNIDLLYRIVKDSNTIQGFLVFVARGKEPIFIGDVVKIRDGASFRNINQKEVLKIYKMMKVSQNGHLWLKSLRRFIHE